MCGSAPTLYKIPVTQELLVAVENGQFPLAPTIVQRFYPRGPEQIIYNSLGMQDLENRRLAFQCFEALRQLLVSCPLLLPVSSSDTLISRSEILETVRLLSSLLLIIDYLV